MFVRFLFACLNYGRYIIDVSLSVGAFLVHSPFFSSRGKPKLNQTCFFAKIWLDLGVILLYQIVFLFYCWLCSGSAFLQTLSPEIKVFFLLNSDFSNFVLGSIIYRFILSSAISRHLGNGYLVSYLKYTAAGVILWIKND